MDSIDLSIFSSRIAAICDEMGAVLQRAAFSPNIRDRLDYSCAVFDADGGLCAQAAHIPVHLGSMAYAMNSIVTGIVWSDGDMVVMNDPFLGGTHLPDVTVIAPVFVGEKLRAFVVNRAHHADIGATSPGSMPISHTLQEEGVIIPPTRLQRQGRVLDDVLDSIVSTARNQDEARGDFSAQISANQLGVRRLQALIERMGAQLFNDALLQLNDYAERLAQVALKTIPNGRYSCTDVLDDDGLGNRDLKIHAVLSVDDGRVHVDFAGTAAQTPGNVNCPLSVAAAAVYYVFRCLMPAHTPACAGSFRLIRLSAPLGCLINAQRPAAVAAGNVETSTRIVDVVTGALAQAIPDQIPAASHGSMNNLAMGGEYQGRSWDYYETMGGGMGAGPNYAGLSGVQTHMTNTRNTPIEVLEQHYPVRVRRYALRKATGGKGLHQGGNGLVREFEFLAPTTVTLLTERRRHAPWGLQGGHAGRVGENHLNLTAIEPKVCFDAEAGDVLSVCSAGGGAWGKPDAD